MLVQSAPAYSLPGPPLPPAIWRRIFRWVLGMHEGLGGGDRIAETPLISHPQYLVEYAEEFVEWGEALLQDSGFWTTLCLWVGKFPSADSAAKVEAALRASGDAPLDITVIIALEPQEEHARADATRAVFDLLAKESHRWTSLVIRAPRLPLTDWPAMTVRQLRYLELDGSLERSGGETDEQEAVEAGTRTGWDTWMAALRGADQLRSSGCVVLRAMDGHAAFDETWTRFEDVRVIQDGTPPTGEAWRNIFSHLRRLAIVCPRIPRSKLYIPTGGMNLEACHLRQLTLTCSTAQMRWVLKGTSLPRLEIMYLEARDRNQAGEWAYPPMELTADDVVRMAGATPALKHAAFVFLRAHPLTWLAWLGSLRHLEGVVFHGLCNGGMIGGASPAGDHTQYMASPLIVDALANGLCPALRYLRIGPGALPPTDAGNSSLVRLVQARCRSPSGQQAANLSVDITSPQCDAHTLGHLVHVERALDELGCTWFWERRHRRQDLPWYVDGLEDARFEGYDPGVEIDELGYIAGAEEPSRGGDEGLVRWGRLTETRPTLQCATCRLGEIGWEYDGNDRDEPDEAAGMASMGWPLGQYEKAETESVGSSESVDSFHKWFGEGK
ncbi:hypothetical protein EV714DRAFT_288124 [Schizophyllum commune]